MTSLAAAETALREAQAHYTRLKDETDQALKRCHAAGDALQAARIEADSQLPKATMKHSNGRTEQMVVVKRTAKEIRARRPGSPSVIRFRHEGAEWWQYPRPSGWGSRARLEVTE